MNFAFNHIAQIIKLSYRLSEMIFVFFFIFLQLTFLTKSLMDSSGNLLPYSN